MSPLLPWHEQAEAELQDYFGTSIVSTYGRLPLEYAAAYRSCAVMDMAHRGILGVSGPDRLSFLNSLLTAELVSRETGKPVPQVAAQDAFLLDRKGRIQAQMTVVVTADSCILEMDRRLLDVVAGELEKYRFREKITIEAPPQPAILGFFGPAAVRVGELLGAVPAWRDDLQDVPGMHIVCDASTATGLWEKAIALHAVPIGWAAYNALRIESFRPVLGIDYDSTFLPAETGQLDRTVSFTKGCYPGQEIVARMQSRDQLVRRVSLIKIEGGAMPLAGEKVFDEQGNQVGVISSSTMSPRQGNAALALALLKKPYFKTGAGLRVPAEGTIRDAIVL